MKDISKMLYIYQFCSIYRNMLLNEILIKRRVKMFGEDWLIDMFVKYQIWWNVDKQYKQLILLL